MRTAIHVGALDVVSRPRAWRVTVFRVLAGLAGALFIVATLPQAISPWGAVTLSNTQRISDANLHRWSAALAGGPDVGMGVLLLYLAWRPMRAPLVLQWLALAATVFLVTNVPFVGLYVAVIAIPVVLVLAAYPDPRSPLRAPWADGVRVPSLALGLLVAIFLLADASREMAAQIRGSGELALNYDAVSNAEHLITLSLAALLAGMTMRGSRALGLMAAGVLAFMGAAAITVPTNPGSWGLVGGAAAIAGGLALAAASLSGWPRRISQPVGGPR
jgi:hypothetical protein